MQKDIDQIKQLLKPVMNEDKRLEALMSDESVAADLAGKQIVRPTTPEEDSLREKQEAAAHAKKLELIGEEEDAKVKKVQE